MKYCFKTEIERDASVKELQNKGVDVYGVSYYPFGITPLKYVLFTREGE